MSPPEQILQQFTQAISSGKDLSGFLSSNVKLNIPQGSGSANESVGGSGATTPGAANVKILDSFSSGDRIAAYFEYDAKADDATARLRSLCIARLDNNGKVVEATIQQDTTPLTSAGGAQEVAEKFNKAVEGGNAASLTGLFANNLQHDLDRSGIETNLGSSSVRADAAGYAANANVKILDQIVAGDKIVTRFQYDVNGDNVPGAAKGSKATVTAICIARVENGKIVESNIEQDTAGLYLQLGLGVADSKAS